MRAPALLTGDVSIRRGQGAARSAVRQQTQLDRPRAASFRKSISNTGVLDCSGPLRRTDAEFDFPTKSRV